MENGINFQFWGEFEHGVDDKGRVILPQEFRSALGDEFVVTRGPDNAILLVPTAIWDKIQETMQENVLQRQTGFLQRMMGGRQFCKLDPQFRLAIPKHLREWAKISSSATAVIIGQGKKIEIWSKAVWDEYNARFTSDNMFDAMEQLGIKDVLAPS